MIKDYPETHQQGHVSIENKELILNGKIDLLNADFGVQISKDGRVWICINSIAFIRFKPNKTKGEKNNARRNVL